MVLAIPKKIDFSKKPTDWPTYDPVAGAVTSKGIKLQNMRPTAVRHVEVDFDPIWVNDDRYHVKFTYGGAYQLQQPGSSPGGSDTQVMDGPTIERIVDGACAKPLQGLPQIGEYDAGHAMSLMQTRCPAFVIVHKDEIKSRTGQDVDYFKIEACVWMWKSGEKEWRPVDGVSKTKILPT